MTGVVLYIDDSQDNIFLLQRLFKHRLPDTRKVSCGLGGLGE